MATEWNTRREIESIRNRILEEINWDVRLQRIRKCKNQGYNGNEDIIEEIHETINWYGYVYRLSEQRITTRVPEWVPE